MLASSENPYASPSPVDETGATADVIFSQGILATRWQRFLGYCIDLLLALPLLVLLSVVLVFALRWVGFAPRSVQYQILVSAGRVLITAGVFILLHGYLLTTRGQTIGKYLLKTQIVAENGDVVPLVRLLTTRYLPFWILVTVPVAGPLLVIMDVTAIYREECKCFHDDIAGTKVIQID